MVYRITAADRALFKRCRRRWDFGAGERRSLAPSAPAPARGADLGQALRDALAVYYFPGMWDWDRSVVLPLVVKGLQESIGRQRSAAAGGEGWDEALEAGQALLGRYFDWAPGVDRFSPIRAEVGFEVNLPHPAEPGRELATAAGQPVRYTGTVELLVTDASDSYWVVSHRVSSTGFQPEPLLRLDEATVTAAWAWERFQLDVTVEGTIHNELLLDPAGPQDPAAAPATGRGHPRGGLPQHEPSGGGRAVPFHRRVSAQAGAGREAAVTVEGGGTFRRTWIRRERAELDAAGTRLAREALDMLDPGLPLYPSPSPGNCADCAFVAPCLATDSGGDVEAVLAAGYRRADQRPGARAGRLGMSAWGMGRGAVLPPPGQRPS